MTIIGRKTLVNPVMRKAVDLLYEGDFKPDDIADLLDLKRVDVLAYLRSKQKMKEVM